MLGPPGSGKTMLAKRMPTILPDLTPGESIETTRIYSAVGRLKPGQPLLAMRPFRSPHHTISDAGLVGGGSTPTPGEISLAHNGVLFLDELPEFNRRTLEVLRQPLEDGTVTISRALTSTTFPANFMLIAALNPCPCGYRGDARRNCHCTPPQIERYMSKISGPLLDRIDIHIEVPAVPFRELSGGAAGHVQRGDARAGDGRPAAAGGALRRQPDALQRRHDAPPDAAVLPAGRRVPQPAQGGDDRAGPLGPGPRQDPPRGPDHRRPRRQRGDPPAPPERGDQLPHVGPAVVDVSSGRRSWVDYNYSRAANAPCRTDFPCRPGWEEPNFSRREKLMTTLLSEELREALAASAPPIEVRDDKTNRVFYLISAEQYEKAREAFEPHEDIDPSFS